MYPRTHITSDMCTPGRDTQNTEALHPGLLELQRKHGGYEEQTSSLHRVMGQGTPLSFSQLAIEILRSTTDLSSLS